MRNLLSLVRPALVLLVLFTLLGAPTGGSEFMRTFQASPMPTPLQAGVDQIPMELVTAQYLAVPVGPFYKYFVRPVEGPGVNLRPGVWKILKERHVPVWNDYFESLP